MVVNFLQEWLVMFEKNLKESINLISKLIETVSPFFLDLYSLIFFENEIYFSSVDGI